MSHEKELLTSCGWVQNLLRKRCGLRTDPAHFLFVELLVSRPLPHRVIVGVVVGPCVTIVSGVRLLLANAEEALLNQGLLCTYQNFLLV